METNGLSFEYLILRLFLDFVGKDPDRSVSVIIEVV